MEQSKRPLTTSSCPRQEALYLLGDPPFGFLVERAASRTRKAGMHCANAAVATQDERRREGVEVHRLRQLLCELLGLTCEEHGTLTRAIE